jgi:hypothetical protein
VPTTENFELTNMSRDKNNVAMKLKVLTLFLPSKKGIENSAKH